MAVVNSDASGRARRKRAASARNPIIPRDPDPAGGLRAFSARRKERAHGAFYQKRAD